ncbi:5'-AMP-activated protein kinase subunit beta-2-like [Acipenser oxyrinchus oxyrinchus]|uniref:5'-AMP-activated protein kinase subunit beta-2-like n=1 Tax=Acipenser oxyrinchus oxyrinchus TaxID=40147 RepID=A0AAD8D5I0_ACIOX|nr:5'-AMP-activated protein kinase subunit beta-2-like [Acipenser oxyrinchus oxyrinchus]
MGNTSSDRVLGDRHGAKSHRSDGVSSSQAVKEQETSKIMVDSADDPNIFNTHILELKPSAEKEFMHFIPDSEEPVKPPQQARPTVIRWAGGGKEVYIAGSFNSWATKIPLNKSHNDFVAILDLPEGEHQYKFFVDGQWVHDTSEPVVTSQMGTINNLIQVKKSDFEVFDALNVDSLECSDSSDLSSSPPGPYGQEVYTFQPEERFKSPPILPPHLLQVILNKDTNISCDPALLPEPNHVMLNHLYALSIKDGVMVLSATHRYKKKYVTSLLYKPI